jgi:hypothetical protein
MNFLAEKIEKLLLNNECVIIHSFGGFIKNDKSATIVADNITPPMVEVSFNSMLRHDDGLLCSLIADENNISYKAAMQVVNKHLENLRSGLLQENRVIFGNIGEFIRTNDTIEFIPFVADYLPENYGQRVIKAKFRKKAQNIGNGIVVDDDVITIKISDLRQRIVRYAAMVALIGSVSIFMPNVSEKSQYAGLLPIDNNFRQLDKTSRSDSVLDAFAQRVNKDFDQNIETQSVEKTDTTNQSGDYHIVVASFDSYRQAESFCNTKRASYDIKILPSKHTPTKYRCISGSFRTEQQAIDQQNEDGNTNSWILYQRQENN